MQMFAEGTNPLITAQVRLRPEFKKWDIVGLQMISGDRDAVFRAIGI